MDVDGIFTKIDDIVDDFSIPKRVKSALAQIKVDLQKDNSEKDVVITSSIYILDEITNDVNISMHAKTVIWDIISDLESLKK